ncbi:MAG: MucBP domain-containing protein, partial [Finegoldia magna]|nr:MucBP domain-containing protein [Finegoldia magna]
GTTVVPTEPNPTEVTTDEGTWTFKGYDRTEATIDGKDEHFVGTWEFIPKEQPKPETGSVYVKYVTEDGKELEAEKEVLENAEDGTKYTTEQKTIDGYEFVEIAKDSAPVNGKVEKGDQHVTYVYKKTEVTPPVEEKGNVYVKYVTEDGEVLEAESTVKKDAPVGEAYTTEEKTFDGYEFVKLEDGSAPANGEVEKGDQHVTYVYKKKEVTPPADVVTEYVDEDGKTIAPQENGTKDKKDIPGYEFVETKTDDKGNTKHIYKKKTTLSPTVETRYVDTEGNQILADKAGTHDPSTIEGYQFVRTDKDKNDNTIHVYKKIAPVPKVETRYVDENGNQLLPPKEGEQGSVAIDGYNYIRTSKDNDGNTIHTYSKTPFEGVETKFVDTDGNQILDDKAGTHDASTIEGYQLVRTDKDENGNTIHVYKKIAPAPKVETRYVDVNGNQLLLPKEGTQAQETIEGYEFVKTETDDKGNTKHIYKKKANSPTTDVVTEYVDENGKTIAPKENGTKDKKDIDGYEFVKNEKDEKGNTKHIYKKKTNTRPITQSNNTINSSSPNKKGTLVNTGDGVNASTYAIIMLAIGAVLTGIGIRKKKKEA